MRPVRRVPAARGETKSPPTSSILAVAVLISVATGCGLMKAAPPPAPPTVTQLENATYSGVLEQPITLESGSYIGAPFVEGESRPGVLLWNDLIAYGDVDALPGDEAAVLLSSASGGSGERVYLAVVGISEGRPVNLGTVLIGDRVKVRTMSVVESKIVLDVVEADERDAACCPTHLARRSYELEGEELRKISSEAQGTLSLKTLEGTEWQLVWLDEQAPRVIRLPTLNVADGRLSGFGGCNGYDGTVTERAAGQIKVSRLTSTRMACPSSEMDVEQHFLQRLEQVDRYSFVGGRLALSGGQGDDRFLLLLSVKPSRSRGK